MPTRSPRPAESKKGSARSKSCTARPGRCGSRRIRKSTSWSAPSWAWPGWKRRTRRCARERFLGLANKECLVAAGELITAEARQQGKPLLPIDSEHNAVHQCLRGGRMEEVERIWLTASGGPFLNTPQSEFRLDHRRAGAESSHLEDGAAHHHRLGHADE